MLVADGPLIIGEPSATMPAAGVNGVVVLEAGCVRLRIEDVGAVVAVWPAGTTWDAATGTVVLPDGQVVRMGDSVEGGGGYYSAATLGELMPTIAEAIVACLPSGVEASAGDQVVLTYPQRIVSPSTTVIAQASALTLHVSNQSFADDPVGITITIDGTTVVDDDFFVEGQHTWITFELELAPGEHVIDMVSSTGVEQSMTFSMPSNGHRWAVVDYWYYPPDPNHPGSGTTPRSFSFMIQDEPILFA